MTVAPTESTLNELREDLYKLADIYIEGSYGSFSWPPQFDLTEQKVNWTTRVFRTIPAFLGIVMPLILMVVLVREPRLIKLEGVGSGTISLILIAWLLLAIDVR